MPLFQKSVLNKHLKQQDKASVTKAYNKFTKYFHDTSIQANIRASKEEEYQGIFLTELFVNILGYTMKPNTNFNLVAEYKNEKNSRKADGAILKNDNAIGVIELKGTNTKDLEHIRQQAFDYKANQTGCVYVITSNFEKIRFYINNAVDFEEFDLFNLTLERFELLTLCLSFENINGNIPLKIKEDSLQEEEKITKKFYSDYSLFKRELFRDLVKLNLKNEVFRNELNKEDADRANKNIKQALFKKSQKLIDRFLFVFFAEDRELLPPNSTKQILNKWKSDVDFGDDRPIYDLFKLYFNYLDTGRKGTDSRAEIFAYNGGLFKPDTILDSLLISNDLLFKHCDMLQAYDFDSQVDVNILGHIFENSLNEIESVNAEIEGAEFDKQTTKRKKDGVFYTPKYITKYIVDNTVGKLCEEKKAELKINAIDTTKNYRIKDKRIIEKKIEVKTGTGVVKSVKQLKTNLSVEGEKILNQIEAYRAWLLKITICDPACGSGAFLNQALNFLIAEHGFIDELLSAVQGKAMVFPNIENTVLENNIFGVDINEESVEIAKLSLWLRTAQPRRKLNDLSSNIKCGNSLIDSKAIAGDKAFNWTDEFPHVFEKGGFDVVIGNPPYVRQELFKDLSEELKKYSVFSGKGDLFTYFYEKGVEILKNKGYLSYISSGKFFEASYGKPLVTFLVENVTIKEVINFDDLEVFEGISAYPLIFTGRKGVSSDNYKFKHCFVPDYTFTSISEIVSNLPFKDIYIDDFKLFDYNFYTKEIAKLIGKIKTDSIYLKDINCLPLVGVKTGFNDGFTVEEKWSYSRPYVFGKNLKKYQPPVSHTNIIFPYKRVENEYSLINSSELFQEKEHLENQRKKLESRAIIKDGILNGSKVWFEYQQVNKKLDFDLEYIVYPNVSLGANFTISTGNIIDMTGFIIPSNDKSLLALLNSKVCEFIMSKLAITRRGGYQEYKVQYLEKVPLKSVTDIEKIEFSKMTGTRTQLTKSHYILKHSFQEYLQTKFPIEKLSKKLQNWHEIEFGDFIKELNKAIKAVNKERDKNGETLVAPLTKTDEMEWMELFNTKKAEADTLKAQIEQTDREIDQMVYKLYELTPEEIKIVENS